MRCTSACSNYAWVSALHLPVPRQCALHLLYHAAIRSVHSRAEAAVALGCCYDCWHWLSWLWLLWQVALVLCLWHSSTPAMAMAQPTMAMALAFLLSYGYESELKAHTCSMRK